VMIGRGELKIGSDATNFTKGFGVTYDFMHSFQFTEYTNYARRLMLSFGFHTSSAEAKSSLTA
jgi:hypothetical protein